MRDPHDDDTHAPTGAARSVERVRARVSVTSPRIPQPTVSADDDEDSIFGATLSGKGPAPRPAATPSGSRERTETTSTVPSSSSSSSSGSGPVERAFEPMATRNRSGLAVVRTADIQAAPLPAAPTLAPSLLPPRRASTAAPPPPPALSTSITPRPPPPTPQAVTSLDPPIEPSQPARRAPAAMALDPSVEPSGGRTRPPTGLMSLDPPVEPSGKTKAPSAHAASVSTSLPSGMRDDGTPLSAAEAALPGLFRSPEQVVQQRRRIQIAATGVGGIVLAIVTLVLWLANRPPPPKTGSVHFAVTDKATVTHQYLAGLPRLDLADVAIVVTRVVAPVARSLLPKDAPAPEVVLTRDAEAVAFSTPDGRLVFSQGMLMSLSSQAELAALAAHLLAHQTRYHLDDAIDAEAKVLVPEVRAAVGSNMATPGGTRVATVDLWHTFSDAEEMEADSAAIIALQRANWDATALRTLWQRLDGGSPKPALFKQHPLTPARLAAIEAAERLRLQGSDLVRGDAGRTNAVEYQAWIKDVIVPPVIVVTKAAAEPTTTTTEPVVTRLTTPVAAPAAVPKKEPVPEPPTAPTPRSARDAND